MTVTVENTPLSNYNVASRTIGNVDYQETIRGLVNVPFDQITISPASDTPTTITYLSAGTTVCTLTLTWSGSYLTGVQRS